jgi:hypothetical protein
MKLAAHSRAVEATDLTAVDYREYRRVGGETSMPSPLAISRLFAGWQRACEHLATATYEGEAVEVVAA